MKTAYVLVLSLTAITASLVFVLSSLCAYGGGLSGRKWEPYTVICAIVSLAVVVAAMWLIGKLNRKPGSR